jgi:hypothetical protein
MQTPNDLRTITASQMGAAGGKTSPDSAPANMT